MLAVLRAFSLLPLMVAAKVRREERRLIRAHLERGAVSREHAARVGSDGRIAGWVRERLVRNGVLKATSEGSYLDETAYAAFRWRRRRRALVMATLLLLGFGMAIFRGDIAL